MNSELKIRRIILETLEHAPRHGYALSQAVQRADAALLAQGEALLYPHLHQWEAEELLSAEQRLEEGRVRRYYRLTERGARQLAKLQRRGASNWRLRIVTSEGLA